MAEQYSSKNESCSCCCCCCCFRKPCCSSFSRGFMSGLNTVIILFNLYDIVDDLATAFTSRTDEPIREVLKIFAFIALPVSLLQTWLYYQHKFGLIWHPRNPCFNELAPERRNDESDETFKTLEWRYDVTIYWATVISLIVEVFPQSMLVYFAYEHRCPSNKFGCAWVGEAFEITCTVQAFLSLVAICMYCFSYRQSVRECATFCKSRGCLCRESCCECCDCCCDCCEWNVKCNSCGKEFRECQCLVKKHRVECCCCCRCEIECPSSCASCTGSCLIAVAWFFRVLSLLLAIVSLGVSIASLSIFLSKCS